MLLSLCHVIPRRDEQYESILCSYHSTVSFAFMTNADATVLDLFFLFFLSAYPFPNKKCYYPPKLIDFADDNFIFDEYNRKFSKPVENIVGNGEIARYEQFHLFPQCFHKTCTVDTSVKRVKRSGTYTCCCWLVVLGFHATLTAKVISLRSVTLMCYLAFSHQY